MPIADRVPVPLRRLLAVAAAALVAGCASTRPTSGPPTEGYEIRAAERALVEALESPDPTAWVQHYTQDAVFAAPGAPTVQGRAALLQMARTMKPLSSVRIVPSRTEISRDLATVYGRASWVSGRPPDAGPATSVRFIIVWRKEPDGQWRVAQELLNADPSAK